VQALIARHNNDLMRVIDHLYGDNFSLREKNRTLKEQVKDLGEKAPKDGAVVLTKAEADLLESYKALGDIETLKTAQSERDQFKGELGALRKDGILRDVAEVSSFKFPVLKTLSENKALNGETELEFEIKEVEKDGQRKKVAFVKNGPSTGSGQASGEAKPLADYATEKWADFLPSLQAQPQPQTNGVPYPSQTTGGPPAPSNVLADFKKQSQEARAAQPNPLNPVVGSK
jgi:hypothetical protein